MQMGRGEDSPGVDGWDGSIQEGMRCPGEGRMSGQLEKYEVGAGGRDWSVFPWRQLLQSLRAKTVGGEEAQTRAGGVARVLGNTKFSCSKCLLWYDCARMKPCLWAVRGSWGGSGAAGVPRDPLKVGPVGIDKFHTKKGGLSWRGPRTLTLARLTPDGRKPKEPGAGQAKVVQDSRPLEAGLGVPGI